MNICEPVPVEQFRVLIFSEPSPEMLAEKANEWLGAVTREKGTMVVGASYDFDLSTIAEKKLFSLAIFINKPAKNK